MDKLQPSNDQPNLKRHLIVLATIWLYFFACPIFAGQNSAPGATVTLTEVERNWLQSHPVVQVGGSPDWTPFNFVDQDGNYSGIANDYLTLIAEKTGIKLKISIAPWEINLRKIQTGEIDVLGAVYHTEAREQYLHFSKPYFEVLDYFFIRSDLQVEQLEELDGKRLAIPKSYANVEFLRQHFPAIKLVLVDTFGDAIDTVLERKAEILYDTYGSLIYTMRKEGINTLVPFESTRNLAEKHIYITTRKDAPELASIIEKGLNAITYEEKTAIYERWLGSKRNADEPNDLLLSPEEMAWIAANPVVNYGAETDWPPFDFINADGEHDGISREYLNAISALTGLQFSPHFSTWPDLMNKTIKGELDLLPALYFSPQRAETLNFSRPYRELIGYFFIRDNIKATSFDDLEGKIVAIPEGFLYVDTVGTKLPKLQILIVKDLMAAIQAVIEGRADLLIDGLSVINYIIEKNSITGLKPFKPLPLTQASKLHMATPAGQRELLGIINKALVAIPQDHSKLITSEWLESPTNQVLSDIVLSPEERRWLDAHPVVRFTGDPNWLPYEAFDANGNYIGIVAEYLDIIEGLLGIEIERVATSSWTESIEKIKKGEVDILSETSDSSLTSDLRFTREYLSSPVVIIMNNDHNYVDSIAAIKHQKIAVIKDYGYLLSIQQSYPDTPFINVNSIQEGLTAVSTGKVDALVATLTQASYHIAEMGINNIRIVGKTRFTTRLAFGMREDHADLIPLFNRALEAIPATKKQEILNRWGKHEFPNRIDYRATVQIAGVLLIIILITIYWNRKLSREIHSRKAAEEQLKALMDNIPVQVVLTRKSGHILFANPHAINYYGLPQQTLLEHNILDLYGDEEGKTALLKQLSDEGRVDEIIININQRDGSQRSLMLTVMPIIHIEREVFLSIGVDITERIEIESALSIAKEQAELASRAKSTFLANMSHEIRTPMNAILGFATLLEENVRQPQLKSYVKIIRSAGNNLLILINDILDLSKIEAGKLTINKTACNPHQILSEVSEIFSLQLAEKELTLRLDIDPNIPESLKLDPTRIRQVLFNLLGNAVKFTDAGLITLCATAKNKNTIDNTVDIIIAVEDTGIGIAEHEQQNIFSEFEQSRSADAQVAGTGLGLAISKRLVEMMGGNISLCSEPSKGSCFTIHLSNIEISSLPTAVPTELLPIMEHQTIQFSPSKILVTDDIADNRELLVAMLADTPIEIDTAKNGVEAVQLSRQKKFDLILMDIRMPIMDGYEAAKQIKRSSNVPIIALTASVMESDFENANSDDFSAYLRKPLSKKQLITELSRFLPYQNKPPHKEIAAEPTLSPTNYTHAAIIIPQLESLLDQHQTITASNNIQEIEAFAKELLELNQKTPIDPVLHYGQTLLEQVAIFDIIAIRRSLNAYPQLIEQLKVSQKAGEPTEGR